MQDGRRDASTVAPVSGTAAPATPAVPAAKVAVAIICKTPIAGKSKTRLSPPLRPEECAEISACFITDLGSTIGGLDHAIAAGCAVYTPAGSEVALQSLLPADFQLVLQGKGDLGDRLLQGVNDLLAAGYAAAILINSDSPTLPPAILQAAIEAVREGDKVVLSPAIDGGYTLIGLSCAHRRLFQDIPWSTEVVFQLTLDRAREIGLPVVILDPWYDIDDAGSYAMLEAELSGQRPSFAKPEMPLQDAPATRLFVERRRAAATSSKVQ
ncbi:MAG: glycosyltransferase [Proteobacteria bacterium]|nr:MAG: glycosyltransferase [Pseudomonadota bacterium]